MLSFKGTSFFIRHLNASHCFISHHSRGWNTEVTENPFGGENGLSPYVCMIARV